MLTMEPPPASRIAGTAARLQVPRAHQVHVEHATPHLVGEPVEVAVVDHRRRARVVDHHVEVPPPCERAVDERPGFVLDRHVGTDVDRVREGRRERLPLVDRSHRVHDDAGALRREALGDRPPDPAGRAADDGHLSLQQAHRSSASVSPQRLRDRPTLVIEPIGARPTSKAVDFARRRVLRCRADEGTAHDGTRDAEQRARAFGAARRHRGEPHRGPSPAHRRGQLRGRCRRAGHAARALRAQRRRARPHHTPRRRRGARGARRRRSAHRGGAQPDEAGHDARHADGARRCLRDGLAGAPAR